MRLFTNPLDTNQVAASADAAILHAEHDTSAAMLLGGVPMFLFPQHVEQMLIARNVAALDADAIAPRIEPRIDLAPILTGFLDAGKYEKCAETFAARHRHVQHLDQVRDMVIVIEQIFEAPILYASRTSSFG